jgi:hypothetical protein
MLTLRTTPDQFPSLFRAIVAVSIAVETSGDFGQDDGQGEVGIGFNMTNVIIRPDDSATVRAPVSEMIRLINAMNLPE